MTIDFNFIPETLTWRANHYVPPIKDYIMCKDLVDVMELVITVTSVWN